MLYYDKVTKQFEPDVHVHNFSKSKSNMVRIIGSIKLNPSDVSYPDKKWVMMTDLYENVNFTPEFIVKNTLG